jgi:hypothetical protein
MEAIDFPSNFIGLRNIFKSFSNLQNIAFPFKILPQMKRQKKFFGKIILWKELKVADRKGMMASKHFSLTILP